MAEKKSLTTSPKNLVFCKRENIDEYNFFCYQVYQNIQHSKHMLDVILEITKILNIVSRSWIYWWDKFLSSKGTERSGKVVGQTSAVQ
jgi:hypothetical protein